MKGNLGNGNHVCFSHNKDDWETPDWLYQRLDKEFDFALDAAATKENTKSYYYNDLDHNSLQQDWLIPKNNNMGYFSVWLNPPYSKNKEFIKKAYEESLKGATVVCLVPCRTDTQWWHDYVMNAAEIRFIRGRLYFNDGINPAPFPSCIVIFRNIEPSDDTDHPWISTIDARPFRNYKR